MNCVVSNDFHPPSGSFKRFYDFKKSRLSTTRAKHYIAYDNLVPFEGAGTINGFIVCILKIQHIMYKVDYSRRTSYVNN